MTNEESIRLFNVTYRTDRYGELDLLIRATHRAEAAHLASMEPYFTGIVSVVEEVVQQPNDHRPG